MQFEVVRQAKPKMKDFSSSISNLEIILSSFVDELGIGKF